MSDKIEDAKAEGKQPNLRSIHVTEQGIWFDDAFIPHIAISSGVKLTSRQGHQQVTLTVNADIVSFEGDAHATIAVPYADSVEAWPDTRERHERLTRDEPTLTSEHRVSETYSHIERDPEYVGVEDRTPTSRPAGFGPVDARPHIASLDNMVKDMTARVTDAQERYYIPTRYVAGTSPLTEQAIRPPRRLTTEELNSEAVRNLNINRPM